MPGVWEGPYQQTPMSSLEDGMYLAAERRDASSEKTEAEACKYGQGTLNKKCFIIIPS